MTLSVAIAHRFGAFSLGVEFRAEEGITALFGRSGAGKSSVIAAIAGLLAPDEGRVELDGRTLYDASQDVNVPVERRRVGIVFQDGRLFPHLSVRGNLAFARRFGERRARSDDPGTAIDEARILQMLALEPHLSRRPRHLSGGEKQRVAIARALFMRPKLLLLDEPLAALDEARKAEILPYLERLADVARLPMIYVSHSVSEVARLADRVVLMREGKSVAVGPVEAIFADAEATRLIGPRDAGAIVEGVISAHDAPDGLTEVALSRARLVLPTIDAAPGTAVRVRVRASDVILALRPPEGLSTRNVIAVTVAGITEGEGPGALVELRTGADVLLARVTRRAARALDLRPELEAYAILKAIAVPPEDVTLTRRDPGSADGGR